MSDQERQTAERHLTELLVRAEYRDLYLGNAWFKVVLDALVRYLPFLVDGLASASLDKQVELERHVDAIKSFLAPGVVAEQDVGSAGSTQEER